MLKAVCSHLLLALFAVSASVNYAAPAYQNVYSYVWLQNNSGIQGDSALTPSLSMLSSGQSTTFTAKPPDGNRVTWWAWGPTYDMTANGGRGAIKDSDGDVVTNLVSQATSYTFTRKTDEQFYYIGVRFDYFPYRVRLNKNAPNDSSWQTMSGTYYYTNTFNLAANPFSRTGYAFAGWTTNTAQAATLTDGQQVTGKDIGVRHETPVNLYATWTANEYAVAFDGNGATSGSMANQSFTYDVTQSLSPNAYARELGVTLNAGGGSVSPSSLTAVATFQGWATTASGSVQYQNGQSVLNLTTSGTKDLYAKWQDGSVTLPTPTKTGSDFLGWYTAESGGTRVGGGGDTYCPSVSTNLYAQWQGGHTVTFVYYVDETTITNDARSVRHGQTVDPVPNANQRLGYTATGWNGSYTSVTEDRTLIASYLENSYTVRFHANGGSGEMKNAAYSYTEASPLPNNQFTRRGYSFLGWNPDEQAKTKLYDDGQVVSRLSPENGGKVDLYAVWAEIPKTYYYIRYESRGGTGVMPVQKLVRDEPTALASNAFGKAGCRYLGWTTEATAPSVVYTNGEEVVNLAATDETNTLYAVWANNAYTVEYCANGGEGTMATQAFRCHEPQDLVSNAFTRVNCRFAGWTRDPAIATAEFTDGQEVMNLTYEAEATVRLYALWTLPMPGDPSDLAIALDRPLDIEFSISGAEPARIVICSNSTEVLPGENDQFVRLKRPEGGGIASSISVDAALPQGTGTLSFWYRASIDETAQYIGRFQFGDLEVSSSVAKWTKYVYEKSTAAPGSESWIFQKGLGNASDHVDIDKVVWTPDAPSLKTIAATFRLNDGTVAPDDIWANLTESTGVAFVSWPVDPTSAKGSFRGWYTEPAGGTKVEEADVAPFADVTYYAQWGSAAPVPTPADRVEASSVMAADGKLGIGFTANPDFAYNLLATDTLTPVSWYRFLGPTNGTGTLVFPVPLDPSVPQRFFKIETIQKSE